VVRLIDPRAQAVVRPNTRSSERAATSRRLPVRLVPWGGEQRAAAMRAWIVDHPAPIDEGLLRLVMRPES
jgi:hypothetical protein